MARGVDTVLDVPRTAADAEAADSRELTSACRALADLIPKSVGAFRDPVVEVNRLEPAPSSWRR